MTLKINIIANPEAFHSCISSAEVPPDHYFSGLKFLLFLDGCSFATFGEMDCSFSAEMEVAVPSLRRRPRAAPPPPPPATKSTCFLLLDAIPYTQTCSFAFVVPFIYVIF